MYCNYDMHLMIGQVDEAAKSNFYSTCYKFISLDLSLCKALIIDCTFFVKIKLLYDVLYCAQPRPPATYI